MCHFSMNVSFEFIYLLYCWFLLLPFYSSSILLQVKPSEQEILSPNPTTISGAQMMLNKYLLIKGIEL